MIYIARHCKTEWNLQNRLQGSKDLPLSKEGRLEATANVPCIQSLHVDKVVSSDCRRAYGTAQIYSEALNIGLYTHPGLRELDHGDWEGNNIHEMLADPNCTYKLWLSDPRSVDIPGGSEDIDTALSRIVDAIKTIASDNTDENVLVVTHKHIRALLQCALLNIDLKNFKYHIKESIEPEEIAVDQVQDLHFDI